MAKKKRKQHPVRVPEKDAGLIRDLIDSAGQEYWQGDQGYDPKAIQKAKEWLAEAEDKMLRHLASLHRKIRNLQNKLALKS